MRNETYKDGRVTYYFDTITKTVFENGKTRPMTPEEAAQADLINTQETRITEQDEIIKALVGGVEVLQKALGKQTDPAGTNSLWAIYNIPDATLTGGNAQLNNLVKAFKASLVGQKHIYDAVIGLATIVGREHLNK